MCVSFEYYEEFDNVIFSLSETVLCENITEVLFEIMVDLMMKKGVKNN
jgi:hypothetical protein